MTLYAIDEDGNDKSIFVGNWMPSNHMTRIYFVGNSETSWDIIKKIYGEWFDCGDDEWKFYENTAPTNSLDFQYGKLHYIDLPTELAYEMVYNSSGLGIACLYTSLGRKVLTMFTELTYRQRSNARNIYGWLLISANGKDGNLHCSPRDIIEYDQWRSPPNLRAVAYDIEMVHGRDECEHQKCENLDYCHGLPSAGGKSISADYINILTGIMWTVSSKPEIISKLTIINCGDSDVVIPTGYTMWGRESDLTTDDVKLVVRSDADLALVFLMWNNRAHMMIGWNSTKFDNLQLLRAVANDYKIRRRVDHNGEFKKIDSAGAEAGEYMSHYRFRFAWDHQITIEGLQVALLYKMLRTNQKSLASAARAFGAGEKMDVSMREMELHWRDWRAGRCELKPIFVDYCMNDSMLVHNMFRDIYTEMIFAENVGSNLELLNLCHSRLPYCEPLFHRRMLELRQVYDARIKLYGNMYPMYSQVHTIEYIDGFERSKDKKKYPGAIVSKPIAGLHRNVAAVDFASLYPNNARQYSLSDGTAWPLPRNLADQLDDRFYHKIELTLGKYNVWMCSLKDDHQVKQGCLTAYMSYCLNYRAEIKQLQAKEVKGSDRWIQLEAGQLTVKRAANGQYGITGMAQYNEVNSNFACAIAYAASITAIGRKFIRAAQLISVELGLRPLYSDTDSIYVETEMECNELASTINSELCEMYHTNDFTREGIIERKTLGIPSTRTPIVLKLSGEANYLWMSQVYKKRYICIYAWDGFCRYCNIKHKCILFKGGPSADLMEFAHKTILTAYDKYLAGDNVQEYLSNVLRETLAGSQPTWRVQNAKPLNMYTKSTPAIHIRHANAISVSMGNSTNEIEFCSIFPERYYTGDVPKSFNNASYPCTPIELKKIYNGRALQLDVGSMTFLTDMKRAAKIDDEARELEIEIDEDGDVDQDDESVNKNELQYEMADVRNEYIRSSMEMTIADIQKWILAASRSRGIQATLHTLPEKLISKKRNFNQLFFFGLFIPRIHSHLRVEGLETARYTMHGDSRRLEDATVDAGINIGSLVKPSEVQIVVDCDVATEIFLATELLGFRPEMPQIDKNHINIIETLWGWYLVHDDDVHFFPYAMALLDHIKCIEL